MYNQIGGGRVAESLHLNWIKDSAEVKGGGSKASSPVVVLKMAGRVEKVRVKVRYLNELYLVYCKICVSTISLYNLLRNTYRGKTFFVVGCTHKNDVNHLAFEPTTMIS